MNQRSPAPLPVEDDRDRAALLLMLSFVEAECLRLGAIEAARHAALAATLMPAPPLAGALRRTRVH